MVRRRKGRLFAAPSTGPVVADTYDRALAAYEREREDPDHTTLSLMGAVASELPPPVAVAQDAVDGIDFLIRHDIDPALIVFAIVRELEQFRSERPDWPEGEAVLAGHGWPAMDNLVHKVRLPRGSG